MLLQEFTEVSLRLPKALKEADSAKVFTTPIHNAQDFVFLGQTKDILEQLGCIYSAQDAIPSQVEKAK